MMPPALQSHEDTVTICNELLQYMQQNGANGDRIPARCYGGQWEWKDWKQDWDKFVFSEEWMNRFMSCLSISLPTIQQYGYVKREYVFNKNNFCIFNFVFSPLCSSACQFLSLHGENLFQRCIYLTFDFSLSRQKGLVSYF